MQWTPGILALLAVLPATVPAQARPAQVVLIRHAEKPNDPKNPHLSKAGVRHAQRLVSFMTTNPAMTKFGPPAVIFATHPTKDDDGQRSGETVTPLAKALKMTVQTPYVGRDYAKLAKRILADPTYAGKTVLIAWNHEELPQLAAALGVTPAPPKWKGGEYNLVYIISYPAGKATLTQITQ